jgi:DNA-directed RNA polymerase specialized sigma24 family protein
MQLVSLDCAIAAGLRFDPVRQRQDPSAWQIAEYDESVGAIRSCLASLPICYRDVLLWYFGVECMPSTKTEIAARIGISRQAVGKRLHKATILLREMLIDRGFE